MDSTANAGSVLHVCDPLLPISQTFVRERLFEGRFRAVVAGWKTVDDGLSLPCPSVILPPREGSSGPSAGARVSRRLTAPVRHVMRDIDLVRVIVGSGASVVHAHFGPIGVIVKRACLLAGVPLVVSFYGFDVAIGPGPRRPIPGYRDLFETAAAVTAEGPALARRLVELGAPRERVKLLPLGLPAWAVEAPRRIAPESASLNLLQVARFVEKKGIDVTLRALALLRASGVAARLTLVGDGPLKPLVEREIDSLHLRGHVDLPGYARQEELAELLSRAHVLVQPSRTARNGDTEGGYPTIIVEAQAQAVAVAGTYHADIPMVVRHGETGLLSPEGDPAALAENLARLARDRGLLVRMGQAGRKLALRRHDADRMLALRERIYREALRTSLPHPRRARLLEAALRQRRHVMTCNDPRTRSDHQGRELSVGQENSTSRNR